MSTTESERVRAVLSDRGLTQRELAVAIDLDSTKLSKSLTGRRRFSVEELRSIASAVHVPLDWLVALDDADTVPAPTGSAAITDELYAGPEGRTRRAIIDAAWVLIAERGHHAVRVSDVAVRAGVSAATVHYHFDSRRRLLEETLRRSAREAYTRQVEGLEQICDGADRLRRLIELQLPEPGVLRLEWSIWLQVWTEASLHPDLRALHAQAYARWHETITAAIALGQRQGSCRPGDAEVLAARLAALVDGLGVHVVTGRPGCTVQTMRAALRDHLDSQVFLPVEHDN